MVQSYYIYGIRLLGKEDAATDDYSNYHFDSRGSTAALSSETGTITDHYNYGPYGDIILRQGTTENIFLYVGQYGVVTDANGLYQMRARYYNPEIKAFINEDDIVGIIEDSLTLNRYTYANGNPIIYVDPLGHAPEGSGKLIASTNPYFGLDQESIRERIDKLIEASEIHKAVQYEVSLRYGPFIIEYPIKGGGKNGGYGSIDVYDPFTGEAWEVKPDNKNYTRGQGSKQLERYIKAGNGTIVPGHILESFSFTYNSDMTVSVRSGSSPYKYESGMIYYSVSPNQGQPSTEPQTSILGEAAGAMAGAGAAYWIISELSRLFPPRNLIPVP